MHKSVASLDKLGPLRARAGFRMVLEHHKSSTAWSQKIDFDIPEDLNWFLKPHLDRHSSITQSPFLFVRRTGEPFDLSSFHYKFSSFMHAETGISIGPQMLRHIFATELRDHPERPGPAHQGAAMASSCLLVLLPRAAPSAWLLSVFDMASVCWLPCALA